MPTVLITTTRAEDLQSLGAAGQTTTDAWSALQTLLKREFSPAHANLLAEPVPNPVRGETDWYADLEAPPWPITSLSPGEQQAARQVVQRLAGDILALAERMGKSSNEGDRFLSGMLELAVQIPDDTCIYVSAGHPVLIAWGHARAGAPAERIQLKGQLAAVMRQIPIDAAPRRPLTLPRILWPLLTAALAVAVMLLAAASYTVLQDPFGWYDVKAPTCQLPPGQLDSLARLQAAESRESELRAQLAALAVDAGSRRLQCQPVPAATPPHSSDEQRARDRGAQTGRITVILAWDDRNDLDLRIACPGGELIFFDHRSACGGTLDVDANGDSRVAGITPVENVFFNRPAAGRYRVLVDPYAMRVSTTSNFRLTIKQEGKPDQLVEGVAANGEHMKEQASFTVDAGP